jgi:hypothetical protein
MVGLPPLPGATKPPTPKQAKINAARRAALAAALQGRESGSSTSLAASYGLTVADVQISMRAKGVRDDG